MKKSVIARDLTLKLYGAENAVDASLTEMAEMLGAMIKARTDLGLAAPVGTEALNRTGEAITALLVARTAAVAAHAELQILQDQFNIRPIGMPPGLKNTASAVAHNDRTAA